MASDLSTLCTPRAFRRANGCHLRFAARQESLVERFHRKRWVAGNVIVDVPPISETVSGFDSPAWFGLFAPAATANEIVGKWRDDVVAVPAVPALPEIGERAAQLGVEVDGNTPEAYAALVRSDIAQWRKVVKVSGAKAD